MRKYLIPNEIKILGAIKAGCDYQASISRAIYVAPETVRVCLKIMTKKEILIEIGKGEGNRVFYAINEPVARQYAKNTIENLKYLVGVFS